MRVTRAFALRPSPFARFLQASLKFHASIRPAYIIVHVVWASNEAGQHRGVAPLDCLGAAGMAALGADTAIVPPVTKTQASTEQGIALAIEHARGFQHSKSYSASVPASLFCARDALHYQNT